MEVNGWEEGGLLLVGVADGQGTCSQQAPSKLVNKSREDADAAQRLGGRIRDTLSLCRLLLTGVKLGAGLSNPKLVKLYQPGNCM